MVKRASASRNPTHGRPARPRSTVRARMCARTSPTSCLRPRSFAGQLELFTSRLCPQLTVLLLTVLAYFCCLTWFRVHFFSSNVFIAYLFGFFSCQILNSISLMRFSTLIRHIDFESIKLLFL